MTPEFPHMEQSEWEFGMLCILINSLVPKSILEIGVFQGGTLARFASFFPFASVSGVDVTRQYLHGRARVQPGFPWLKFHGARFYEGDSHDPHFMARVVAENGGPFDVTFIDGDHTYPSAKSDWEWALQNTTKLIALHDVNRPSDPACEVDKLWSEIQAPGVKCVKIGGAKALGIGCVWL